MDEMEQHVQELVTENRGLTDELRLVALLWNTDADAKFGITVTLRFSDATSHYTQL